MVATGMRQRPARPVDADVGIRADLLPGDAERRGGAEDHARAPARRGPAPTSRSCRSGSPSVRHRHGLRGQAGRGGRDQRRARGARDRRTARWPSTARTAKDGSFTLNSVPPGDYTLQARADADDHEHPGRLGDVLPRDDHRRRRTRSSDRRRCRSPARTSRTSCVTSKGATVTGPRHVRRRATASPGADPRHVGSRRPGQSGADDGGPGAGQGGRLVRDQGACRVAPVRVAGSPPGWTVKSVKLNGDDITDTGAEFKPGEATSAARDRADVADDDRQRR